MKKNIIMIDCEEAGLEDFREGLSNTCQMDFEWEKLVSNGIRTGKLSEINRYFKYFLAPLKVFLKRKQYGMIIGWQQFYALIFCFYCSFFHVKKSNRVVAVNFTYKEKSGGVLSRVYKWFMGKCLDPRYMDFIHVPSNNYADIISRDFNFPRKRIIVSTFGIEDSYLKWKDSKCPDGYKHEGYVMSIGRSNRDFDFLVNAWKNVSFPLVIISDTWKPKATLPKNIKHFDNISGEKQYPWLAHAKAVVIPIDDGSICSGDTVLLTTMSFARTVIVTTPSTLGEMYIEDKINGYLTEKNVEKFKPLITGIIDGSIKDVGEEARNNFLDRFSRKNMGINIGMVIAKYKRH